MSNQCTPWRSIRPPAPRPERRAGGNRGDPSAWSSARSRIRPTCGRDRPCTSETTVRSARRSRTAYAPRAMTDQREIDRRILDRSHWRLSASPTSLDASRAPAPPRCRREPGRGASRRARRLPSPAAGSDARRGWPKGAARGSASRLRARKRYQRGRQRSRRSRVAANRSAMHASTAPGPLLIADNT